VVATADFHACIAAGWIVVDLTGADGAPGADGSPGAAGTPGALGAAGVDGLTSLGEINPEPAGANCAEGGISFVVGIDDNDNAILEATEVDQTQYVCNGASGSGGGNSANTLLTSISSPSVADCDAGGSIVKHGVDNGDGGGIAQNGILEAGEVDFTTTYCSNDVYGFQASTTLVVVEYLWPYSLAFTKFDNMAYFISDDGTNGVGLWKTDGTDAGTAKVKTINLGTWSNYMVERMHVSGNAIYFWADDGTNGLELWKSDGTESGTMMIKDINPGGGGSGGDYPSVVTSVGNSIYFWADDGANGFELWKSDGTDAGTEMFKEFVTGSDGSNGVVIDLDGNSFYIIEKPEGSVQATKLWISDGTGTGTTLVKDFTTDLGTNGGIGYEKLVVGNTFFFTAMDRSEVSGDLELWKSDGTEAGTILVKDINLVDNDGVGDLVELNNVLYFQSGSHSGERELWKSDGSETGTIKLTDLSSDGINQINGNLYIFGNSLYFEDWFDDVWQSDGTAAGTTAYTGLIPFASARLFDDNGITFSWQEFYDDEYGESAQQRVISDGTTTGTISFESNRYCGDNNNYAVLIGYTIICFDSPGLYFGPMAVDVDHEITYS
jgi:ELWxxDGT repeat protein